MKLNFNIVSERLLLDDYTLVSEIDAYHQKLINQKKNLDCKIKSYNKNNYLDVKIARLAYDFVKEEHESLHSEAQNRGLVNVM